MMRERISGVMKRLRTSVCASKTSRPTSVLPGIEVCLDDVADELNVGDRLPTGRERHRVLADALAEVEQLQLERVVVPGVFTSPRGLVRIRVHAVQGDV